MIKKYIYNPQQAKYYIEHGVLPLDVDIHYRTHRRFWVFSKEATEEVYSMWCEKCKEYKRKKGV